MSPRFTWSKNRRENSQSAELPSHSRRRVLHGGAAAVTLGLAGCLGDDDDDEPSEEVDGGDEDRDDDDLEDDLLGVVESYLEAAATEDLETMDELSHELNPLNPALWVEEDGWEFEGGDPDDLEDLELESEVAVEDGTVEDVLELEGTEFWFERDDLEEELGDADVARLDIDVEEEPTSKWVLVSEDEEWEILYMAEDEEDEDLELEDVREEQIIDEDEDVLEEIDWEYEPPEFSDPGESVDQAQVILTDERGVDADRVRVESSVAGGQMEVYDDEEHSATWTGMSVTIDLDPDGDQVVVTAIDDGEETVVHREHYES